MPAEDKPIIERAIAIANRWCRLVNHIVPIDLKLVLIRSAIFQDHLNKALIAVFERVVFSSHFAFGLPVVPTSEDSDIIANQPRRKFDDFLFGDDLLLTIVCLQVDSSGQYLH